MENLSETWKPDGLMEIACFEGNLNVELCRGLPHVSFHECAHNFLTFVDLCFLVHVLGYYLGSVSHPYMNAQVLVNCLRYYLRRPQTDEDSY